MQRMVLNGLIKINAMKKKPTLVMTELFLVKADWNRTFMGAIVREKTEDGKDFVRGSVIINEGLIWGTAETEEELAKNLDEITIMKLDKGLHNCPGHRELIGGRAFFLN
jgi:hypothetical protein